MLISDWSSDVCSSDLHLALRLAACRWRSRDPWRRPPHSPRKTIATAAEALRRPRQQAASAFHSLPLAVALAFFSISGTALSAKRKWTVNRLPPPYRLQTSSVPPLPLTLTRDSNGPLPSPPVFVDPNGMKTIERAPVTENASQN